MDRAGRQPALYGEFFAEDFSGGGFLIPADFSGGGFLIPSDFSGGGFLIPADFSGGGFLIPSDFSGRRIPDSGRFYIIKKLCSISEIDEQKLFKCQCKRDFSDAKQI